MHYWIDSRRIELVTGAGVLLNRHSENWVLYSGQWATATVGQRIGVCARLISGFDVDGSDQAAVLPRMQVGACAQVCVIKAEPRRPRGKRNATRAVCRDIGCSLFGGTIHVSREKLSVPVQLFRRVGIVVDVHNHTQAFLQAEKRTGELAIVGGCRKNALRTHFNQSGADPDGVIRKFFVRRHLRIGERETNAVLGQLLVAKPGHQPRASRAPRYCANCGAVEAINVVEVKGDGSYLGKIAGGLAGALLGNQVGHGTGKTVATVAGAAGGAYVGNEVEKRVKTTKHYEAIVRLENGGTQTITPTQTVSKF